jgi:Rrf2 family protein
VYNVEKSETYFSMRITHRLEYALKGLYYLAFLHPGEYLQVKTIARDTGIPKRFLEQIFLKLKDAGFLKSKRGTKGGYILAQNPAQITLKGILSALEEWNQIPPPPLTKGGEEKFVWNLQKELSEFLEKTSLEDLYTEDLKRYVETKGEKPLLYFI